MKKIRITVNGKVYDCVVEVLEDDEPTAAQPRAESPSPPPPAPTAPAPKAASPAPGNGGSKNGSEVRSPLGGTIQKIFVTPGAAIEEKAPMVLLDAMKMDTYIYAPQSGVVSEVCANVGDTVQVGQLLVRYRS